MRFPRRLITPVLAAVLLVGSAAAAQDALVEMAVESDGTWQDLGFFEWRYDAENEVLIWGDSACEDPEGDVTVAPETYDHLGANCRTIDLRLPHPDEADEPDEDSSDADLNHGDLVSRFAQDVKDAQAEEDSELEDVNRGSLISQIAKLNPFRKDAGEEAEDEAVETEEAEDGADGVTTTPAKPDKPDRPQPPGQQGK